MAWNGSSGGGASVSRSGGGSVGFMPSSTRVKARLIVCIMDVVVGSTVEPPPPRRCWWCSLAVSGTEDAATSVLLLLLVLLLSIRKFDDSRDDDGMPCKSKENRLMFGRVVESPWRGSLRRKEEVAGVILSVTSCFPLRPGPLLLLLLS